MAYRVAGFLLAGLTLCFVMLNIQLSEAHAATAQNVHATQQRDPLLQVGNSSQQKNSLLDVDTSQAATNTADSANTVNKAVKIKISAAGDCTLGSDVYFPPKINFNAVANRKSPAYFLKNVRKVFEKDDLTIVNLEGTLTTRGVRVKPDFAFRGKPSNTKILKAGSVEAVTFSNNHMRDYGRVSYSDTIKNVSNAGIAIASNARVATYTTKGVKVGMVAVCPGIDGLSSKRAAKRYIKEGIKKLKKQKAAIIIVAIHNGIEGTNYTNAGQRSLARYAVTRGADLVLGHHPHVLQGVEKYKGAYIVYSLGNFCFGGNTNPSRKDSMIFQQTFTVKAGKIVKQSKGKVVPCKISSKSSINDYCPTVCKGSAKRVIIKQLNAYSASLGMSFTSKGIARK